MSDETVVEQDENGRPTAILHKIPPACRGCEKPFKFGMIATRTVSTDGQRILCEKCLKKEKGIQGFEAVVYGGKEPGSSVARARAQQNLKRLARAAKRSRAKS